ncbi:sensor histidine kinase [Flammeovirga kamogawensis]|uniref:Histidine kinase/HSP90-like ATPase domain-containing protein n=1 Tax=Flammeovirga kamogawensis TaxID=373891 RepID=A0ABX8GTM0_9BACT|nr:ATP-binding protein [Flammeovirga kamogawensis]MBB6460012.1 signal transduction histidine kinase [Flammeovirga kamogawensis]QWG06940.1 hypothetical protein KM029_16765 [Flammeovirga kamogawensis]TRX68760.1 hypothetical protein EO216_11750 [Flammeovirga kamogawensis]
MFIYCRLLIFLLLLYATNTFGFLIKADSQQVLNCTEGVQIYADESPLIINDIPYFPNLWIDQSISGLSNGPFNKGKWCKLTIESNQKIDKILCFKYTLIPVFKLWIESDKKDLEIINAGTKSDFHQEENNYNFRGYSIPLSFEAGETKEIYYFMDGEGWPTHTDIFLYESDTFYNNVHNEREVIKILRIIVLVFLTLGLIIGLSTRKKIFVFYAISFYGGLLFAESELGLFLKYIPIELEQLNYVIRHVANMIYVTFLMYFYYYIADRDPSFRKILIWITPGIFTYTVLTTLLLVYVSNYIVVASIFTSIVLLSWISFGLCFYVLLKQWNKNNSLAKYTFIVFISRLFVIAVFVSLPHMGIIERANFTDYLYYIFITYESLSYFAILINHLLKVYEEHNSLLISQKNYEKEYSQAILRGQEEERNRIGRELHDYVGGNLALVNKSDDLGDKEIKSIISKTIKVVRDMSHGLLSPTLDSINFKEAILDLGARYNNENMHVYLQFHSWPESTNSDNLNHCYRITQELLTNAKKHSNATSIYLQFFGEKNANIGRIIYEDNGIGFDIKKINEGIGLKNIKYRSNVIGGTITIESSVYGTFIRIEEINL